ncbi:MAG: acylneuraminate cytidylyltransferase family protein [Candidatus Omnitrophica bacterium]|nr:acylneuraminate cytidylyltransferase family protein [Candidatus Omnitrophota bacterium]
MVNNKNILAIIPARGKSKGIPGKNIKMFSGKPLIAWTIQEAKKVKCIDRIVVSTDDKKIAQIAKRYSAEIPFLRPKNLAKDNTPTIDVVMHFLRTMETCLPDIIILLQPTSPLRSSDDIERALKMLISNNKASAVISMCEASENPYWMKKIQRGGFITGFIKKSRKFLRRQDLPTVYMPNGTIYVYRVKALLKEKTLYPAKTLAYVMPKERSIDIDDMTDFTLAELLAKSIKK